MRIIPLTQPNLVRYAASLFLEYHLPWAEGANYQYRFSYFGQFQLNYISKESIIFRPIPPIYNIPPIYFQANTTESTHQGFTTTTHQGWPTGEFYMNRKSFLWYTSEFYMKRINVFLMMPMPSISDLIQQSATSCTSCGTLSGRWTTRSTLRTASCPPPSSRCGQTLPSKALTVLGWWGFKS